MRTTNNLRHLAWGVLGLVTQQVFSQASQADNNGGFGSFLGWNAGANQTLQVRNDANQPIEWYTDAVRRMRLQETAAYGIGSFPSQVKDGSLLLCPKVDGFYSNGAPGPYSLLHLAAASGAAQDDSYRPWMDVGVTFTGNKDHGYVGQKPNGSDYTDMVAHWSDNPGEHLKDRFRFIFTSGYDNHAATGAQSAEGLEFMRMWPSRYEDPRIGVGDFYAANLSDPVYVTEPTERVDMVNGRLRIRQLPGDNEAHERYKVMVVDDAPYPSGERGVVKWVDPSVFATAPDCEWTMNAAAPNHVSTAFGPADPNCPDAGDAVGIGVDLGSTVAVAKATVRSASFAEGLHVNNSTTGAGFIIGGRFEAVGGSGTSLSSGTRGIAVTSTGAGPNAVGRAGNFISNDNSRYTNGVHAETFGGSYEAAAVYAWCHSNATTNIGVMGRVDSSGTGYWAGYFMGDVQITGDLYHGTSMIFSDENLKEQVEDVDGTSELLHALRPKRFHYTAEAQERMGLPDTRQFGFIAQEVEEVLPELVSATTLAAERDTAGQEIHPPQDLKAVNYAGLIPLLVAGYQEQ